MRTVIFDLDGTLADTSADLLAAANAWFRSEGFGDVLDPTADALTAFHGGKAMLRLGYSRVKPDASEEDMLRGYHPFIDYYNDNIDTHTVLYPGAEKALHELKTAGYAIGVCTNKPEFLADRLLTSLGIRDLFGSMIGAQTVGISKPDPKPYVAAVEEAGGSLAQSFLVGDTVTDRKTAEAAGVPCALVSFGPEGHGISRLAPEAMLHHYDDMLSVTRELIG